jgi:mannose-6-phosphate isomerase
MLYPLKFKPIYKERIWGGNSLNAELNKDADPNKEIGESWEISAIEDNVSVVSNGYLADNDLQELIEIYMGDLVGDKIYEEFGVEFPLLIKFIDSKFRTSIQVHPDDATSKKRHKAYGKNEMWYIIDADKDSELTLGFNKETDEEEFIKRIKNDSIEEILHKENVNAGDVYYIPSGKIHSIGKNILLAEIQQTSDITYRIYDFNRKDKDGNFRELNNDLAKDIIDYSFHKKHKTDYSPNDNGSVNINRSPYFTSNLVHFNKEIVRDYDMLDSFIIYMCLEGEFYIDYQGEEKTKVSKGETVLIPACIDAVSLYPDPKAKIIEIYIE